MNRKTGDGLYTYSYRPGDNKEMASYYTGAGHPLTLYLHDPSGRLLATSSYTQSGSYWYMNSGSLSTRLYLGGKALSYAENNVGSTAASTFWPYGGLNTGTAGVFGTYEPGYAMYYADQRYYYSNWGRFLTADPSSANIDLTSSGSWNRYAYVNGDPINGNDPTGQYLVDCMWYGCGPGSSGGAGGGSGGGGAVVDGVQQTLYNVSPLGGNTMVSAGQYAGWWNSVSPAPTLDLGAIQTTFNAIAPSLGLDPSQTYTVTFEQRGDTYNIQILDSNGNALPVSAIDNFDLLLNAVSDPAFISAIFHGQGNPSIYASSDPGAVLHLVNVTNTGNDPNLQPGLEVHIDLYNPMS